MKLFQFRMALRDRPVSRSSSFGRNPVTLMPQSCVLFCTTIILSLATGMLASCGLSNGPGVIFVDPGHYVVYHCDALAARLKELVAREHELRGLIDKASESPSGVVIGSLAYGSGYESVLTEEKLVQRTAIEKKCASPPDSVSDHTIH